MTPNSGRGVRLAFVKLAPLNVGKKPLLAAIVRRAETCGFESHPWHQHIPAKNAALVTHGGIRFSACSPKTRRR